MNFNIAYYYPTPDGNFIKTYVDKTEWMKIEPHRGDLWLYENLGHAGNRISVGTYDYCWDYKLNAAIATFRYYPDLIVNFVRDINRKSNIIRRIEADLTPEMSTEYIAGFLRRDGKIWCSGFNR